MIPRYIMTCELCTPVNGKHQPQCPLSEESLARAEQPPVEPQKIPVLSGVPQAVEWMKQAEAKSKGRTALTADERKDAANREADANEAEIRLTQTEKGNISDQTQFNWKWKLAIVGGITGVAALLTKLAGCF